MEVSSLTNGKEMPQGTSLLVQKAKEIAAKLVSGFNSFAFKAKAKTRLLPPENSFSFERKQKEVASKTPAN